MDTNLINLTTILCALLSGIAWNLFTWWIGLPSSSSHALIGGLCGAALASAHGNWSVIKWSVLNSSTHKLEGLWPKVILPMISAPACGIIFGFVIMSLLMLMLLRRNPREVDAIFGRLQLVSAAWMSYSHGTNDAQKTMGIIALTLFTATHAGTFQNLPGWAQFLHTPAFAVAVWIKVICALTMAAGTAAGGWRIIRTMGKKLVKIQKIHGFAAQTTAAAIIQFASHWGMPLSTTHVISTSIMGVGATKGLNAVKWTVVERMVWAWILTLPITAFLGYLLLQFFRALGWSA